MVAETGAPDRWRMLGLIGIALILSMATWFSATAILADLRHVFGMSESSASWLTNAVQLGFVISALVLSVTGLADALPLRSLMAGAALLAALSNLAMLAAPGAGALLAARFVTGVALAGVYPPALKLIATWFVRGRGLAMGAAVGALTLGSSAPYLVRAIGAAFDWRLVVVASSIAAGLSAALLVLCVREGPYAGTRPKPDLSRIGAVIRDPALSLANLGYFGHMWELYAMWGWFLAYVAAAPFAKADSISAPMLTFFVIAVGAAGCVAGGLLGDRIGRTATAAGMMIVSGLCAASIGLLYAGPAWLFIGVAFVWGFAVIGDSAQFSAMVTELSDAQTTGAAIALQTAVGFALTIISIRLTPIVAASFGWRWTFAMLAPGPFIGAAAMFALRARPEATRIANGRR